MSFSSDSKTELCRSRIDRKCCAVAECYGVLLFCNTFTQNEIRIITACKDFAQRLPRLFRKAFGTGFDVISGGRMQSLVINDREKIRCIFTAFGADPADTLSHHVNFAVPEEDCCKAAFARGAFLAGGSVTDPEKGFHCELATPHRNVCRETGALLREIGMEPKEAERKGSFLLYFKQADAISDFFTSIGAPVTGMNVVNAKVEREMRNSITRQVNCDSANADKVVSAAQEQLAAIRAVAGAYGLDSLPDPLRDAALLRIANPSVSLSDLALLSYPPVTKSCLNHRLKKIMSMAEEIKK